MSTEVASLYATLKLSDQASGPLRSVKSQLADTEASAKGAGKSFQGLGAAMGIAAGAGIAFFGAAVASAIPFEKSMANIRAVTGATAEQMKLLNAKIMETGANSTVGVQATADAYYDIAGGVADASARMAILDASVKLAEAGQADLGGATKALIQVMNSYKLGATDAAFASDVLTRTVAVGVGTMDDFGSAIGPIAGLMAQTGQGFDDVGKMLAYMTVKGDSAAGAATKIKAATTAMLNPNKEMTSALRRVNLEQAAMIEAGYKSVSVAKYSAGAIAKANADLAIAEAALAKTKSPEKQAKLNEKISGYQAVLKGANSKVSTWVDANGKAVKVTGDFMLKTFGLSKTLSMLSAATGGSQTEMAKLLGSTEALQAALALTGGDFTKFASDFDAGMVGATDAARKLQLESPAAQIEILKNKAMAFVTSVGTIGLPLVMGAIKGVEAAVGMLGTAWNENFLGIRGAAESLWGQISGPLDTVRNGISTFFSTLGQDTKTVTFSQAVKMGNPMDDTSTTTVTMGIGERLKNAINASLPMLAQGLGDLGAVFKGWITSGVQWVMNEGPKVVQSALQGIVSFGGNLTEWWVANAPDLGFVIGEWVKGAADWLRTEGPLLIQSAMQALFSIGGGGGQGATLSDQLRSQIQPNLFSSVIENAKSAFLGVFGADGFIAGLFEGMFGLEKGTVAILFQGLFGEDGIIQKAILKAVDFVQPFINEIARVGSAVSNIFSGIFDTITRPFKDGLVQIGKWMVELAKVSPVAGEAIAGIGNALISFGGGDAAQAGIRRGNAGGEALGPVAPKRAAGGPVSGGRTYLVGENGPELFKPTTGGDIIPNGQLGGGGGNIINITLNAVGIDDPALLVDKIQRELTRRNQKFAGAM